MDQIIKQYLKNHLTIEIDRDMSYDGNTLIVKLLIDGEKISSDRIYTDSWDD